MTHGFQVYFTGGNVTKAVGIQKASGSGRLKGER